MATARKRGKGYQITTSGGYDVNGTQIRRYMTWVPDPGMTPRQTEKELARQCVLFEEHINFGMSVDGNIRFYDFAEKWMADYSGKQLKIRTAHGYRKHLERIYRAIGHIKLKDLRTGHLNSLYANLEEAGFRADIRYTVKTDLLSAIQSMGLTRTALARQAGIALGTVRSILAGKKVNQYTASAVSTAIDKKLTDIFTQDQPSRTLSPSTIRTYHRIISSCLGKAVKWGYISHNPAVNAQLPRMDQREAPHLDEDDARRLLALLHNEPIKYRVMITFDLLSGLRRGELLGLRWRDIDFASETITVCQTSSYIKGKGIYTDTPKNKTSSRPLKLSRSVFVLLREYREWQDLQREACGDQWRDRDGRVFTADDGAPVHPDSLTKWFSAFVNRNGLPPVHLHSLRHTYASLMIADGIPLVVVSRRLGHAQVSTTSNIYAHVIASADEKAAQVSEKFADVVTPQKPPQRKKSTA